MTPADPALRGELSWERLADDHRPRRLKRGKHFTGEPRDLQAAASHAASAMGRAVRTFRDELGHRNRYVWVQFADVEVELGAPCARCGHTELDRTHRHFGACPRCGARLLFVARREKPARRSPPAPERPRLGGFTEVELVRDDEGSDETMERFWGRGIDGAGALVLMQVKYPLAEGHRLPDPAVEGEELHFVNAWAIPRLTRAEELGVLDEWLPARQRDEDGG